MNPMEDCFRQLYWNIEEIMFSTFSFVSWQKIILNKLI